MTLIGIEKYGLEETLDVQQEISSQLMHSMTFKMYMQAVNIGINLRYNHPSQYCCISVPMLR